MLGFCVLFAARTPDTLGTQQAGRWRAATHWLSKGLTDYNPRSATPSDVRGKHGVSLSFRPQGHGETVCRTALKAKEVARCKRNTASGLAGRGGESPTGHGAFPRVARRGGNVPVVLHIRLSRFSKRVILPFTI